MNQLRNSPAISTVTVHDPDDMLQSRRSNSTDDLHLQSSKRARTGHVDAPNVDAHGGETVVNLKQGQLEDESSTPDTVLDGMGALNSGDEEDYGYFGILPPPVLLVWVFLLYTSSGPSSNIAFIGHVTRALASSANVTATFSKDFRRTASTFESSSRVNTGRNSPAPSASGEFDVRPGSVNIYVLPPQKRVLHYINLYFSNTNILFPYLHQPSFQDAYDEALKGGFSKVRRTWLALLNLVMAMGSRASTEPDVTAEEKYRTAEVFYQRGFGLCDGHFLRLASLDSGIHQDVGTENEGSWHIESAPTAADESLFAEYAETEPVLDYAWFGSSNRAAVGAALKSGAAEIPAFGERTKKAGLVWLRFTR
jgi:Fungal specific transcription factor domain